MWLTTANRVQTTDDLHRVDMHLRIVQQENKFSVFQVMRILRVVELTLKKGWAGFCRPSFGVDQAVRALRRRAR